MGFSAPTVVPVADIPPHTVGHLTLLHISHNTPARSSTATRRSRLFHGSTRDDEIQRSTSAPSNRTSRPIFRYGMRRSSTSRRTKRGVVPNRSARPSMSSSTAGGDTTETVREVVLIPTIGTAAKRPGQPTFRPSRPSATVAFYRRGTYLVHEHARGPFRSEPERASEQVLLWWRGQDLNL